MKKLSKWHLYIIECDDGSLYTGITTDVTRRWHEHTLINSGNESSHKKNKGAKFFRSRAPIKIVFQETHPDRSSATKRETQIKKLNRTQKLALISNTL